MTTSMEKRQNGNPASFGTVVDNIFHNSLKHFFDNEFGDTMQTFGSPSVPVNVRELNDAFEIDVVAPGLKKNDFTINLKNRVLTISFEEKRDHQQAGENNRWVRNEFVQRSFSKRFTLDDAVDTDKIDAAYNDGILRLRLAKSEKAQQVSREIQVQ